MPRRSATETVWLVVDATVAVAAEGVRRGSRVGVTLAWPLRLLTDLTMRPPLVPQRYWPDRWLGELADVGRDQRRSAIAAMRELFRQLVLAVVAETLDQLDLPEIIRESAGPLTSDTVQGGRPQSIEADQAVAAWVDRVFGPRPVARGDTGEPDEPGGPG